MAMCSFNKSSNVRFHSHTQHAFHSYPSVLTLASIPIPIHFIGHISYPFFQLSPLPPPHAPSEVNHSFPLTHSLTNSFTRSLTHSLTHSFTHSLSHTLTHSHTHTHSL